MQGAGIRHDKLAETACRCAELTLGGQGFMTRKGGRETGFRRAVDKQRKCAPGSIWPCAMGRQGTTGSLPGAEQGQM